MDTLLPNVYLVGGAVRDQLLNQSAKDKDYVVVGETQATMLKLGFVPVGSDFPVFLHPKTKHEYALARTERKSGPGYTGFVINSHPSVTLEEDLARRDLTINSMALADDGRIIDPFNGQHDLQNKILKHTSEAFVEDPVRVLRVARFMARYGETWSIHPETLALIQTLKDNGELTHLVPERVWQETEKALGEQHPELFFTTLHNLGIFNEIDALKAIPQPKEHHPEGDVFIHTMLGLKRAAEHGFDIETRFAVLMHDLGKAPNYHERGNLHGHEQRGVPVIEQFCQRFKVPNRFKELAVITSDNHTRCHKISELTAKTLHKLLIDKLNAVKKPQRFQQFLDACLCDAQGRGELFANRDYPQALLARKLQTQLANLDKKALVQTLISQGKQGPQLGEAVRKAEIACIRDYCNTLSGSNHATE